VTSKADTRSSKRGAESHGSHRRESTAEESVTPRTMQASAPWSWLQGVGEEGHTVGTGPSALDTENAARPGANGIEQESASRREDETKR
jgi:hypothetical protein